MNLSDAISHLIQNTTGAHGGSPLSVSANSSLWLFLPEIVLCVTIALMLLVRILPRGRHLDSFWFALFGALVALGAALTMPVFAHRVELFTGMLAYDSFTVFMRCLLLLFAVLFAVFTRLSGVPHRDDAPDLYTLTLGATLGMCLMVSANHLLMVFLAVEMASVPSYALAALMKGRREAGEAALKYAVYGGGTAGVMLYGISLVAGLLNTAHLPTMAERLAERLPVMPGYELMVLALGGLMIMVGLAFKLSAVPFHFWCPDVFEGATAEIDAFLSVASKAAAFGLLVRVVLGLGMLAPATEQAGQALVMESQEVAQKVSAANTETVFEALARHDATAALAPARNFAAKLLALLAAITCTFGNLAAYGQTNIKRMLAYSTIAHAGYMAMAIPPMLALSDVAPAAARDAVAGLGVYLAVYLFLNLGVFTVAAFLRNALRSEQIADYGGLMRRCPGVVVCFALMLFGLIGLPPLSGFIGKFAIFASLADGYRLTSQTYLLVLLILGGLNTALSLFYYLRVVKVMTMDPEPTSRGPFALPLFSAPGLFLFVVTIPTAFLIARWDFLNELARGAARQLL